MKLTLQTRCQGDIVVIQCHGRIVYRDEAATFSRVVREELRDRAKVVLDLGGVSEIDCAGIGEIAMLYRRAQSKRAELKYAQPQPFVRRHLDLTRLNTVIEIHPNLKDALNAFKVDFVGVFADC